MFQPSAGYNAEETQGVPVTPPVNADKASFEAGFDKEAFGHKFMEGANRAARRFSRLNTDDLVQDAFLTLWQKLLAGLEARNPAGLGFQETIWRGLKDIERTPERRIPHIPVEEAWHLCDERADAETHVIVQEHIEIAMGLLPTSLRESPFLMAYSHPY